MENVIVITGGTSGFGKATALRLIKNKNNKIIVVSNNVENVENVKKELRCDGFVCDVTKYASWQNLKEYVITKYGRIDVLFNCAGGGVNIKEINELTDEDIDKTILLNLNSAMYGSQIFSGIMKKQKSGTIINVASVCARHSWTGWSVYAGAKAGVLQFTKGLYVDLQPYGVRVTCLIPAGSATNFQKNANIGDVERQLVADNIAEAVESIINMPKHVVIEEITVWGIDQIVNPL